jgi:AmmeMemoRadiSam system protein B
MNVKRACFAGSWYPGTASACQRDILDYIRREPPRPLPDRDYRSGIVPHAGWFFSGAVACQVIATLAKGGAPDLIVVFGKHLRPRDAASIIVRGALETPLGNIPVHESFAEALSDTFGIPVEAPAAAEPENTIELQLPFIKHFFPETPVVPVGVPPTAAARAIGQGCVTLAAQLGLSLKTLGSTDLTHYGPNYGFALHGTGKKGVAWVKDVNDRRIIDRMTAMDEQGILDDALTSYNACCAGAAVAAVSAGKAMGAPAGELITYTTSYDKSPGDSLVGYAGVVF